MGVLENVKHGEAGIPINSWSWITDSPGVEAMPINREFESNRDKQFGWLQTDLSANGSPKSGYASTSEGD